MAIYNEPISYIDAAVKSILQQTYEKLELIIVLDNPQRDDVVSYIKNLTIKDKRIKFIKNKHNMGLAMSLNKGIEQSRGKYIARMDSDDISKANRLENQLSYLIENNLDLVGCNIQNIDNSGNIIGKKSNYPKGDKKIKKYIKITSPIPHPTWLTRADILKKNKYLDLKASQDYELLTRLALKNIRFGNVDDALLFYRINQNGISSQKRALQIFTKHYVRKNYKKKIKTNIDIFNEELDSDRFNEYVEYRRQVDSIKNSKTNKAIKIKNYAILLIKSKIAREEIGDLIKIHLI